MLSDNTIEGLKNVFKISFIQLGYLIGAFILIGLILEVIEKKNQKYIMNVFGWKGIIFTGIIGTPVHELGHAIMCIPFRHKIEDIRLFRPISGKKDGTLGYVNHSFNSKDMFQKIGNFYIAVAPIILGTMLLILNTKLLVPNIFTIILNSVNDNLTVNNITMTNVLTTIYETFKILMSNIFTSNNLTKLNFWIFLFICMSISTHISLSTADMKGALSGIISFVFVVVVINLISFACNVNLNNYISYLAKYNVYQTLFLAVSIFFSLITLSITFIIYNIKKFIL